MLVVVAGTPTLRAPEGERELATGDCVLFPDGPDGAWFPIDAEVDYRQGEV